jgi:hypothetical protein
MATNVSAKTLIPGNDFLKSARKPVSVNFQVISSYRLLILLAKLINPGKGFGLKIS